MEMEHINENLIKVIIRMEDLEDRGINFLDLVNDQAGIERFFYSILEEIDIEEHFQDSDAVTFQVMPNREGLELYISRTDIDRYDEFWEEEFARRVIGANPFARLAGANASSQSQGDEEEDHYDEDRQPVFIFEQLEDLLQLCREWVDVAIEASVYKLNRFYFLKTEPLTQLQLFQVQEYGQLVSVTEFVLDEHAELLRADDVFQYFGRML